MTSTAYLADGVLDEHGDAIGDVLLVEDNRVKSVSRAGAGIPSYAARVKVDGYIIPAIIDAHLHVGSLGLSLAGADLTKARNPLEVARLLAVVEGPIAYGRGWDQEAFQGTRSPPSRRDLDRYTADRPAIAVRVCGHMAVANTILLEETRPWEAYPHLVDRENGLLYEDAVYYTLEKILEHVDISPLVERAVHALAGAGIGGFASMSCSSRELEALLELQSRGRLPTPVACYPDYPGPGKAVVEKLVSVVGVKLYADGSFGAHTAALKEPYNDVPGERGRLLLTSSEIAKAAEEAIARGLRPAVHAIGDQAIEEALEGLGKAGIPPGSARIEHMSLPEKRHIRMAAELGLHVVVQPYFRVADWWLPRILGSERALRAYPFKSIEEATGRLALSTDAPVDPYEPWYTFNAAMGICDTSLCIPEESLDWRTTLYAYTRAAARAAGGPVGGLGRIEPGAPAQLALTPEPPGDKGWSGPARLLHTVVGRWGV